MSLYQKFCKLSNLEKAWRKVRANSAASKDLNIKDEIAAFEDNPYSRLKSIQTRLTRKTFKFSLQHGVAIKKSSGGHRPIVIAPIEDRIVQRAILQTLQQNCPAIENILNNEFSFGSIPNNGLSDQRTLGVAGAVTQAKILLEQGYTHYFKSDIPGFFTKIKKQNIHDFLCENLDDSDMTELFKQAMVVSLGNSDALKDLNAIFPTEREGIAQGASLSPLIANIYMDSFDKEMNGRGVYCIRYLDDVLFLAKKEKNLQGAIFSAKKHLSDLNLTFYSPSENPAKSSIGCLTTGSIDFLGCSLSKGQISPSKESKKRLIENVDNTISVFLAKAHLAKQDGYSLYKNYPQTLEEIRSRVHAWGASYKFCTTKNDFEAIDRKIYLKVKRLSEQVSKLTTEEKTFKKIYGISSRNHMPD